MKGEKHKFIPWEFLLEAQEHKMIKDRSSLFFFFFFDNMAPSHLN